MRELAAGSDDATVSAVARWRRRHDHALVIVDQFEELYTQNGADEQQSFAELLGRLALDADVVVLLAMRDDFLIHCNRAGAPAGRCSPSSPPSTLRPARRSGGR